MAKKVKESQVDEKKIPTQEETVNKKQDAKTDKKKKKKKERKNKGMIKQKTKETVSELKKVTWPSFAEVVKRTGVVLAVVLIFAVVIFGFDSLFGFVFGLF